ncbi:MAG: ATPase domain-containing protein [Candidatus Pacearchaeota archaeon]
MAIKRVVYSGVNPNRCPTGIPGFDELCKGGFVRNSTNAIIGGPGTGKSTFLMQFLVNGALKFNENGVYISFEPSIEDLVEDGFSYGWDLVNLDKSNKCKLVKMSPKSSMKDMKEDIMNIISRYDIKRAVIDPITILLGNIDNGYQSRDVIFELSSLFKRLKVTLLIAEETAEEEIYSENEFILRAQFVKFVSDSVIRLHSSGLGGISDRALRIIKMRRTDHIRGPVPFAITNKGILVMQEKKAR